MLYENIVHEIENGAICSVNFRTETIMINGKDAIKEDKEFFDREMTSEEILNKIYDLYEEFKYSVPWKDTKRKSYFKAVTIDELTEEQMICNEDRKTAQAKLESFILCVKLSNMFEWDNAKYGTWFWKSREDEDLVVLKIWLIK